MNENENKLKTLSLLTQKIANYSFGVNKERVDKNRNVNSNQDIIDQTRIVAKWITR